MVAPSEAVHRLLIRTYAYAPEKVWTITNGWGGAGVGAPWARERPKDPIAVSVANFRPEKNHNLLLDAFALVRAQLPRARLVLVGGGPGESAVRERVRTLGLETAVDFTGYVDDVWPFLARSRLFALASSYEPQGMAVLEAMAAGLPVVATAVGGLRESVTPGLTGELVDPVDVSAMAAAMVRILSSDSVAEAMGAAARASAQEHTAERMIEEYFELYDRLLAGRYGAVGPSRPR